MNRFEGHLISKAERDKIKKARTQEMQKKLSEGQKQYLLKIPKCYQYLFMRAFTTEESKALAIKAFCIYCNGFDLNLTKTCNCSTCPLNTVNPWKTENQEETELSE